MPKKPNIQNIAKKFGNINARLEKLTKEKEAQRLKFIEAINFDDSELARQIIYVDDTVDDPYGYVRVHYPKFRVTTTEHDPINREWKILLEEDPEYKTYVLVNALDNKVYQRTIAEGTPGVNLDAMREADPNLYKEVTEVPDVPRELKTISTLTTEQKNKIQKYLIPPKLTVRMEKPREAKPEELDG